MEPGERAELEAWRSFSSVLEEGGFGRRLEVAGGVAFTVAALPDIPMLNRAVGVGTERTAHAGDVESIDAFFRDAGTSYEISLSPEATGLAALLEQLGLEPGYSWAIFRRGVSEYKTRSELRVEDVGDARADVFALTVVHAFGMPDSLAEGLAALVRRPGWHAFLACDGDEPAGGAMLFVHERGAWLGAAGTIPAHRRKGAQGALLAARIRTAAGLGVEVLAAETGAHDPKRPNDSYRNLVRVGFEEVYVRPNYAPPTS